MGWLAFWVLGMCACAGVDALGPRKFTKADSSPEFVGIFAFWVVWPISLPFVVYGAIRHGRNNQ